MRIVTRADLDGVVCALLLLEKENITEPILWVEPSEMQKNEVEILPYDIIANLPFNENCAMWFDHHVTNELKNKTFKGAFGIAPSAAGLIYNYYNKEYNFDYEELVYQTDRIDSADLTQEEVKSPEINPYLLLSMTLSSRTKEDEGYWNHVVNSLRFNSIENVLKDKEISKRCDEVNARNASYKELLLKYSEIKDNVCITDFSMFEKAPKGNRFLPYCVFPETNVSVKITVHPIDPERILVSLGHSIFNNTCNVNVGKLLSNFEGGGHRGAGSCNFHKSKRKENLTKIIDTLLDNKSNE